MKKEPQEIVEQLQAIRAFQPSIIRNTFLMTCMQFLSFTGALFMIIYSVVIYYTDSNEERYHQSYLMLIIALLLLLIWKLTRMVKNRNSYITEINKVMDGG